MMSTMKIKMSKFYTVKKVTCLAVLRIALSSRCIELVDDVSQVLPSIISPTFSGFAREKPVDGNNFAQSVSQSTKRSNLIIITITSIKTYKWKVVFPLKLVLPVGMRLDWDTRQEKIYYASLFQFLFKIYIPLFHVCNKNFDCG